MTNRTSRSRYAILGMLSLGPRSGYDLKREFEERMSHFWAESVGQIYPNLAKLAETGLVTKEVKRRENRPDRNEYALTPAGREELRAWLREPPAREHVRNELLLKLFFGPELGVQRAQEHVEEYERTIRAYLSRLDHFEPEIEAIATSEEQELFWKLTLSSGQHVLKARLAWCEEARTALARFARSTNTERADALP